jgi:hypothetical protein
VTRAYKHALANPRYFLEITGFYWDTVIVQDIGPRVTRVHRWAVENCKPQADTAEAVAKLVISSPPRFTSFDSVKKYFIDVVLSNLSRRERHDDVFWCCFLAELDSSGLPECSLGGPLHKMVYQVHDDFEPDDVSLTLMVGPND